MEMMMGRTRFALLVVLLTTVATTSAGCRKMGLDDTPRTVPEGGAVNLGPKRLPVMQQSESQNTPEAKKAAVRGLLSPDPSAQVSFSRPPQPSIQQPGDNYELYADNNFWSNGSGWTSAPSVNDPYSVPPIPPAPAIISSRPAYAPQVSPPPMPQQQVYAPPLQPLVPPRALPLQQPQPQLPYGYNSMAQAQSALSPLSEINRYPAYGVPQQPPAVSPSTPYQPPQMASNVPMDYPQLQEIPGSPAYRSNSEIAADIADLQNQSPALQSGYAVPNPVYGSGVMSPRTAIPASPVALDDATYFGGMNAPAMASAYMPPALPAPVNAPFNAMHSAPPGIQNNNFGMGSAYAVPLDSGYAEPSFVPPAPVAGVADAPVAAQDWDTSAYRGGSQQQASSGALQLRMPGGAQHFLPNSRYSGRRVQPQQAMGYSY